MPRTQVAIVGGGITGLAAAHRLVELGRERGVPLSIRLLEASDRVGGNIRTERVGDYLLEGGPDALVAHKPAAARLARRIGLGDELFSLQGAHAGMEVVHRGRLVRVPEGFLMMAPRRIGPMLRSPLFSLRGKLRMLCEPWVAPRGEGMEDESLASFVRRRFGAEVLERVAEPVVAGLYTARAEDLSLRLTVPRFLDMEREAGSVIRALRKAARANGRGASFQALEGGLGRFVEALVVRLPEESVIRGVPVEAIRHERASGAWRLQCGGGRTLEAETVVLACPASASSRILAEADPELAGSLAELEYASCATLTLAYPREAIGAPLRSYGFFAPRDARIPFLACSDLSLKFERRGPADTTVLRAFLGGAARPETLEGDDAEIVERTHAALARLLRIAGRPVLTRLHRFPASMPQYRVGQARWIEGIRARAERHPGLVFAGSAVGAMGLPDCIQSGEDAAAEAARFVASRPEPLRQAI